MKWAWGVMGQTSTSQAVLGECLIQLALALALALLLS